MITSQNFYKIIYNLWDIKNISYIDNIPTLDELLSDSSWLKEQKIALVEQAVWQMFYTGGSAQTNEQTE